MFGQLPHILILNVASRIAMCLNLTSPLPKDWTRLKPKQQLLRYDSDDSYHQMLVLILHPQRSSDDVYQWLEKWHTKSKI